MVKNTMDYPTYRAMMNELASKQKTTGTEQSETRIHYTHLNNKRMQRLDKKGAISNDQLERIKAYNKPVEWIVLTESWCGDAAQTLPFIHKIAEENKNIKLSIALRDENLELMDQHLTNGGRAIPKLIMVDSETKEILNTFGPRPSKATKMVNEFKAEHDKLSEEFKKDLQIWYTKDKGENTVEDIIGLMN